ncbi:MAG: hypothetical protein Q9169_008117 [Polycauliona sp. 2 TL-2023]
MSTLQDLLQQSAKINKISHYLDKLELHFIKTPNVFSRFQDILDAFKNQSIDAPRAIERVSDLFAGHADLLEEFHVLIQPQIKHKPTHNEWKWENKPYISTGELKEPSRPNEALHFLHRLGIRYSRDITVFQCFLDMMREFEHGILDFSGLTKRVLVLLVHDPDLLQEFNMFLPPRSSSYEPVCFDFTVECDIIDEARTM